jgi:hypothetical protein
MTVNASLVECLDQPDCKLCPDFIRCTTEFHQNIDRSLKNTISEGYVTYHSDDFIGHEDLLSGCIPA